MKTILVPLDGSRLAEQVLPYARMLAPVLGAKVRLLRVISDLERDSLLGYDVVALYGLSGEALADAHAREQQRWEELRLHAEEYLERRAEELRELGLEVETELAYGAPARQIIEVADRDHAALIAMAAHDYSGFQRWAMGSVTDRVVHATTTPFFIVRGSDRVTEEVAAE